MNDTILNKVASIQRCVFRARDIYSRNRQIFLSDHDSQDAAVLNIMRACELAIDIANHLIKEKRLGLPKSSADSFQLLAAARIISSELAHRLEKMVGFRSITVHEYQQINYEIVVHVLEHELDDLVVLTEKVLELP